MIYLIAYDIKSDDIRLKIAKRLVAEGYERIQFSVFVGLKNPKKNKILWNNLNLWLKNEPLSKFYIIPLTHSNFKNITMIGKNNIDIDYMLGIKETMFI